MGRAAPFAMKHSAAVHGWPTGTVRICGTPQETNSRHNSNAIRPDHHRTQPTQAHHQTALADPQTDNRQSHSNTTGTTQTPTRSLPHSSPIPRHTNTYKHHANKTCEAINTPFPWAQPSVIYARSPGPHPNATCDCPSRLCSSSGPKRVFSIPSNENTRFYL